jgi:type IV pilus assembly protein PilO
MNLQDLNNLDFSNIGSWPLGARIGVIIVAALLVMGAGYWFDTQTQIEEWEKVKTEEQRLRKDFEQLQAKAANLDIYRQQMVELRQSFDSLLRQLPGKEEVAALLVDISQTGLAAGLEFDLFKPGTSTNQEFHDLPIQLKVSGTYHEFGQFVSGVAALPRIVTLHDVTLVPASSKKDKLTMEAVAKIYHYEEAAK